MFSFTHSIYICRLSGMFGICSTIPYPSGNCNEVVRGTVLLNFEKVVKRTVPLTTPAITPEYDP